MLGVALRSFYQGLLSATDLVYILYMVTVHSVSTSLLGLVSLIWSIVFIVSTLFASRIGDSGYVGAAATVSSATLAASLYILSAHGYYLTLLVLGYSLHAVATGFGRISHNISINESFYYEEWDRVVILAQALQRFSYSSLLLLLLFYGLHGFLTLLALTGYGFSLLYPLLHEFRGFERRYSIVVSRLDKIGEVSRYMVIAPDVSSWGRYYTVYRWFNEGGSTVHGLLLSALATSIAIEIVMLPIPAVMKNTIGLDNVVLLYMVNSLFVGLSILYLSGRIGLGLGGSLRIPALALILYSLGPGSGHEVFAALLTGYVLLSVSNNSFLSRLYTVYNARASGYGVGLFNILLELGSVVGDAVIWLVLGGLGYVYTVSLAILLIIFSTLLAR